MAVAIQNPIVDTETNLNPPGPHGSFLRTEHFSNWLLLFLLVAGLLFFRQSSAIRHPAFSDEDGLIYFKQAYEQGPFTALLLPYNGYLQIVPRVVAAFASFFPLQSLPRVYAIVSLVLATSALTFFYAPNFRCVVASDSTRFGFVLLLTVMPNFDSLMRIAYMPWFGLFFISLVVLMDLPNSAWKRAFLFGAVTLATWSTPVVVVGLPIVVFRLWRSCERRDRIWWGTLIISIIAYALTADRSILWDFWRPGLIESVVHAIGYRVFCFFFLGSNLSLPLLKFGWKIITGLSLVLAGVCVLAALLIGRQKTSDPERRRRTTEILLYLIIALPTLFVLRPQWIPTFLGTSAEAWAWHARYFFCSTLLLCLFAGRVYEHGRDWLFNRGPRLVVAMVLLLCWLGLHARGYALQEWQVRPRWKETVRDIKAAETRVKQTGQPEVVRIPNATAIWAFDLIIKTGN